MKTQIKKIFHTEGTLKMTWWQFATKKKNLTFKAYLETICNCGHRRGNHEWMKYRKVGLYLERHATYGVPYRNPRPEGKCSQCSESCQSFNTNKRK